MKCNNACACLLGAAMLWPGGTAAAEETSLSEPALTIAEALRLAEENNPDLAASELRLHVFSGRRKQAALRPPNELSFEVENALGSGELQGLDGAEMTLALSHVVELGEKRQRRVEVVDAAEAVQRSEYDLLRVELAADVVERFVAVAAEQEHLTLTQRDETLARKTLEAVTRRVEAARAPDAELHRARAELQRAVAERRLAEAALARAMSWLASLWGAREAAHERVAADLLALPELIDPESIRTTLDRSPLARRLRDERTLSEAELRLAQSGSQRDITLNGGVRYLREVEDAALVFSASVPLGTRRRREGGIEEAAAALDHTSAVGEAELFRAGVILDRFLAELAAEHLLFNALKDEVLPSLDAALSGTREAYEVGRYGYLELADAQARVIQAREDLIDAAARYHELLVSIERLTGQALARPASLQGDTP